MDRNNEQLREYGIGNSLELIDFLIVRDFGWASVAFGLMEENTLATIITNILNDRR